MRLELNQKINKLKIFNIVDDKCIIKRIIGSVEYLPEEDFIENIYLIPEYRGKHLLRQILSYFSSAKLLPLPEHREKFEHLGYKIDYINGEDIFYKPF